MPVLQISKDEAEKQGALIAGIVENAQRNVDARFARREAEMKAEQEQLRHPLVRFFHKCLAGRPPADSRHNNGKV